MKKDCKKFLQDEVDIFIDEGKLILHGLAQFYIYIADNGPMFLQGSCQRLTV